VQTRDCMSRADVPMWWMLAVTTGAVHTGVGIDVCWIQYVMLQPSLDRQGLDPGPASET